MEVQGLVCARACVSPDPLPFFFPLLVWCVVSLANLPSDGITRTEQACTTVTHGLKDTIHFDNQMSSLNRKEKNLIKTKSFNQ